MGSEMCIRDRGNRLSKIYTRTGDTGETGLGDGSRISKIEPRVEAMGSVDELNSSIGILVEELVEVGNPELDTIADFLRYSQHRIFDLGGELSIPGYAIIQDTHVERIETELDTLNDSLPPLKNFILPGGSHLIASAHLARAICRRAERAVVGIHQDQNINKSALKYLNRLSDYLFVVARTSARVIGVPEVLWEKD